MHDGPGPRITVFLKGCPLRCKWCHNPEGLSAARQLAYKEAACTHCGACRKPCSHPECAPFGRCVHACVNGCLSISGETLSAQHLAQRLGKRGEILKRMGGGITISGGEPMLQADFVCELAWQLGDFHKAIQTSGYAEPEVYRKVIGSVDYVMQDIKLADPQAHIRYTGVSNGRILENVEWLKASGKPFVFRVPLIPGITDTEENLRAVSRIVGPFPTELLPYNPLAGAKYPMVGMEYPLPAGKNRSENFEKFFENAVLLA